MKVRCKHCSQKFELDNSLEGRKLLCPVCGEKFVVEKIDIAEVVDVNKNEKISKNKAEDSCENRINKENKTTDLENKVGQINSNIANEKTKKREQKKENTVTKQNTHEKKELKKEKKQIYTQNASVNKKVDSIQRAVQNISSVNNGQNISKLKKEKHPLDFLNNLNLKLLSIVSIIILIIALLLYFLVFNNSKDESSDKFNSASEEINKNQIICNEFDLKAEIEGSILSFYLKTDLPDDTKVGVIVYRTFYQKNNRKNSLTYYRKNCRVDELKEAIRISIDRNVWDEKYADFTERMKRNKKDVKVIDISNDITLYMYVGFKQTNKKFGKNNKNLAGSAVEKGKYRIVKHKSAIKYPL